MSDINDDYLNHSYSSAISSAAGNNASTSSKAVLAALRALQDKIRRLESERTQALDESAQLRHQLKDQEIEATHVRQRDKLAAEKGIQEVKNAYDRLLQDKADLETHLANLEEKHKRVKESSEEMHKKVRALEDEKQTQLLRIKDLEHQQDQFEKQIKQAQLRERDVAQSLLMETKKHEESMHHGHDRITKLQIELTEVCKEKAVIDAKLLELDKLVEQLLQVNESLVVQISGKPMRVSTPGTRGKVLKKKRSSSVPRAARNTKAAEASKTSKFSKSSNRLVPVLTEDVEQLRSMHKMYANMAKGITKDLTGKKKSSSSSVKSSKSSVNGKAPNGTRLSKKKTEQAQFDEESNTPLDFSGMYGGYMSRDPNSRLFNNMNEQTRSNVDVRLPKTNVSFDTDRFNETLDLSHHVGNGHGSRTNINDSSYDSNYLKGRYDEFHDNNHKYSLSAATDKVQMDSVISSLEEEFESLNSQYRQLLSNVQHPSENDPKFPLGPTDLNGDRVQRQAEEIVTVIQKLHQKGEQLRTLKNSAVSV